VSQGDCWRSFSRMHLIKITPSRRSGTDDDHPDVQRPAMNILATQSISDSGNQSPDPVPPTFLDPTPPDPPKPELLPVGLGKVGSSVPVRLSTKRHTGF